MQTESANGAPGIGLAMDRDTPASGGESPSSLTRRWPVRRSDLEVFLSADTQNDRAGHGRLETERDGST
jgi:hypothetical protein